MKEGKDERETVSKSNHQEFEELVDNNNDEPHKWVIIWAHLAS